MPVLHMALDGQVPVYFEHHVLLWKYPNMQIGLHPLKKGLKRRVFGGMPLLLLEAQSAGEIAFSRDAPGHIAALHLQPGDGIVVREHQFLAATGNVQYDYSRIKGFANMMYGGGFFVDQFFAADHEGVVWVHGYGNVFEKVLEPGETIDIEPGGWVYRDHSVPMTQEVYGFKTGFLGGGGGNLVFNRFTGPGRVGLQSAYFHPPVSRGRRRQRPARRAAAACSAASSAACWTTRRSLAMSLPTGHLASPSAAAGDRRRARPRRLPAAGRRRRRRRRAGSARRRSCWSRPTPIPTCPTPGTQISLHQPRLQRRGRAAPFTQLAAQLGYLRLSGYRLALERSRPAQQDQRGQPGDRARSWPRSRTSIPGAAASAAAASAARLLAGVRALPPAGPPPDLQSPELLRQVLLALALRDDDVGGAEAAELADRALELVRATRRWIRRRRWRRPSRSRLTRGRGRLPRRRHQQPDGRETGWIRS